jgi:hypothetical protein
MLQRMNFGRHKGKPLSELPEDYIAWLLNQPWLNRYLRDSLRLQQAEKSIRNIEPSLPIPQQEHSGPAMYDPNVGKSGRLNQRALRVGSRMRTNI